MRVVLLYDFYDPIPLNAQCGLDLVGFTEWSSGRLPSDVFMLLETLYGSFDTIARKKNVFKVEVCKKYSIYVCVVSGLSI